MSIIRCHDCQRNFDSDFVDMTAVETKYGVEEVCPSCIEVRDEKEEAEKMAEMRAMYEAEKHYPDLSEQEMNDELRAAGRGHMASDRFTALDAADIQRKKAKGE